MNKFNAVRTVVDGIPFASRKEAARYQELLILQKAGIISDLERQVPYELIPKTDKYRAVKYVADFVYTENGKQVVEDTKGFLTPEYKIKRKLMYWKHGIEIQEV